MRHILLHVELGERYMSESKGTSYCGHGNLKAVRTQLPYVVKCLHLLYYDMFSVLKEYTSKGLKSDMPSSLPENVCRSTKVGPH